MPSDSYWFPDGTLNLSNEADDSDQAIAGLRGVTINPSWEITELYTADSTLRDTVKQYEHAVAVEIDYVFFDIAVAKQWLGGQGTTSSTTTTDTSDPMLFNVERVDTSADGSLEKTTEAQNVVFPEFPLVDGSQDEFEEYGLSGAGEQIANHDETST